MHFSYVWFLDAECWIRQVDSLRPMSPSKTYSMQMSLVPEELCRFLICSTKDVVTKGE
jgi:hypothetical protein